MLAATHRATAIPRSSQHVHCIQVRVGFSDSLKVTHRPSPRVMADGRGQGAPREVPSQALDRLFLELHDKLPRDARGKLAQLADEVKTLTESSTAEDRVTPSSSADQAVVRREEEIITAEAKQSSGELQARGRAYCMLSDGII